ncbi:MAG TPA: AMP-binding protein [Clostridiaceae bacterium]|nr:AMP-binding protein [Clostridiaceae bacterium]
MKKGVNVSVVDGRKVFRGAGYYTTEPLNDLRQLVKECARKYGDAVGFKFKDKEGRITGRTYAEFDRQIDYLGTALISLGLKDAHISIIGENRYEWGVCYYSIVNGTGVAVPMDKYLPQAEVENLIERGKVEAIFYSPSYQQMMREIAKTNSRIKYYICMEDNEGIDKNDPRFLTLDSLISKGQKLMEAGDKSFVDAVIDKDKVSIILFTSGTTSISKGVMLSHSNIVSNVKSIAATLYVDHNDVYLSLLPLHHTFENTIGLAFMVYKGVCIAYCDGIRHIAQNLREYKVSVLIVVPAILEAMYKKLNEGIEKSGKKKLVDKLLKVSDALRTVGIDLRRKLFKSIFEQLGPNLRLVVSGAAPLNSEVIVGFNRLGLKVLEGYGLTETSPVVSTNNDFKNKPGTVGPPLADVEVAIDNPDENGMGEIIVRGGNVMKGYYEDPASTAEVLEKDGWLRTGDLGIIDEEGFIKITGRAKSMIVLANGKKAFPEEYEVLLNNIPGVKDSFVWGNKTNDGDVQVCAKLVIDDEKLKEKYGSVPSDEKLAEIFSSAIKEINKNIPQYKIIRYFIMTRDELVKTTTLKIKRPVEYERVKEALNRLGLDMRKANGKLV